MPNHTRRTNRSHRRAQSARNATREATAAAAAAADAAFDQTDEFASDTADAASRTADATANITQRVAEQGREVIWLGMRAAAGMNERMAGVGYGSSHRVLQQAERMMEIYGHASEATAARLQTLFASYLEIGRGMQQMQRTWFGILDRAVTDTVRRPQELLRANSLVEAATIQRDLFIEAVERTVEANAALLQVAERMARDGMGHLQAGERSPRHR
jgi:hypothetical protein